MPTTSNFGWTTPADTDLVKDGAAAIRTLGNGVDSSFVDLKGGTTDQVLAKNSNTDLDFKWVTSDDANAIQNAIVDAKGDIIAATAADTPARLAVGANDTVLTADSSTATGLKWAAPAGGGKVLQVVQGTLTSSFTTTSTSFSDTGLTVSITPSSATSKVLVLVSGMVVASRSNNSDNAPAEWKLLVSSTQLQRMTLGIYGITGATQPELNGALNFGHLDSPNTTSSTTYKVQGRAMAGSVTATLLGAADAIASIIAMEIGA